MNKVQMLRGYIERDTDGSWFAICIDINIYARADSAKEAKKKLDRYVNEYIEEACGTDREHVHDLVPRPAPLRFVLKYHVYRIISQIQKKLHQSPSEQDHLPFRRRMPLAPGC